MPAIIYGWGNPWPTSGIWASLVKPHYHKDGYGVADLIGGIEDADITALDAQERNEVNG